MYQLISRKEIFVKYEDIWKKIYDAHTKILEDYKNDQDGFTSSAGRKISEYRDELISKNADIDAISQAIIMEARNWENKCLAYHRDSEGGCYSDLANDLDEVIRTNFKTIGGVKGDDYVSEMCESRDKARKWYPRA